MDPHRLSQLRSLAYHREIVRRLEVDGAALRERAKRTIARWRATTRTGPQPYLDAWERLLDGPSEALVAVLVADTDEAATLRSCTPFAGVLAPKERWAIWRRQPEELRP